MSVPPCERTHGGGGERCQGSGSWAATVLRSESRDADGATPGEKWPRIGVRFGVRQCRREWWPSSVLALAVLLASFSLAHAQTTHPPPPPYQSLRYDEDYRYLRDLSRRTDVWDVLKYV